jgi:hypothetical protein
MTRFSRSMVSLYDICCLSMYMLFLSTYELHISLLVVGWEREGTMIILPWSKNTTYFERREKAKHHCCLGEDPEIPHIERLERSYKVNSEFYFENIAKLSNKGWSKDLRHSAWLHCSAFQLLKTQVKAISSTVEGNMSESKSQNSLL